MRTILRREIIYKMANMAIYNQKIDTVTFDLWGTLIADNDELADARKNQRVKGMFERLKYLGFDVKLKNLEKAYDDSLYLFERVWATNTEVPIKLQIKKILELANIKNIEKHSNSLLSALEKPYCTPILKTVPALIEDVDETLCNLKAEAFKIGLICNTGRTPGKYLTKLLGQLGIKNYFDGLVFSDELGIRKPHPKIFLTALEKLSSLPNGAVHIGDSIDADIAGAKNIGMFAILFDRENSVVDSDKPDEIINTIKEVRATINKICYKNKRVKKS